jgi:hypothetical protein
LFSFSDIEGLFERVSYRQPSPSAAETIRTEKRVRCAFAVEDGGRQSVYFMAAAVVGPVGEEAALAFAQRPLNMVGKSDNSQ